MVKINVVNKQVNGVEYEFVVLSCESPAAIYSIEVSTLSTTLRADGLVVGDFPLRPSTKELLRVHSNLEIDIELFLQETNDIAKTRMLTQMRSGAGSII